MKTFKQIERLKAVDFLNLFLFSGFNGDDTIITMTQEGAYYFNGEYNTYKNLIRKIKYVYSDLDRHLKSYKRRHEKRYIKYNTPLLYRDNFTFIEYKYWRYIESDRKMQKKRYEENYKRFTEPYINKLERYTTVVNFHKELNNKIPKKNFKNTVKKI